jgi:hypothetical protein
MDWGLPGWTYPGELRNGLEVFVVRICRDSFLGRCSAAVPLVNRWAVATTPFGSVSAGRKVSRFVGSGIQSSLQRFMVPSVVKTA